MGRILFVRKRRDTARPVITSFTIPATSSSLVVSITTFTASDAVGVTGYKLTESSTAPLPGAGGWTGTAPASFTFTTEGTKTLYAWAKDTAGNVSLSINRQVVITLVDSIDPVVTAFIIPATSSSLVVPISTFTATDNVGVVGYMVTESATAPLPGAGGWSGSAPASFTFTTEGTKTLYGWAKDAANNVSSSLNDSVVITLPVYAADYYVASSGDNGNDGLTPSTPWKTIAKVNSISFAAGKTIAFKCGDTWNETLTPSTSGTSGNPITFTSYDVGNKPIISGFQTVTSWTNEGSGIYSKTITSPSTPNIVTLDGVSKPLGRFPKTNYNVMDSVTSVSLTDADLNSGTINYTGATAVIRKHYYVIDRCPITNHSSHTLTITNPSSYTPTANWGYFIENHLSCLTQLGEWAFIGGKLYMYFGAVDPTTKVVQIGIIDKLLTASSKNYITLSNLAFQGANVTEVDLASCNYWTINSCDFKFSGKDGIKVSAGSNYTTITNNLFEDIHNTGFYEAVYRGVSTTLTLTGNTFNRSAIYPGMGGDGSETGVACYIGCDNSLIANNVIDTAGFNGIHVDATYSNVIVRNNYVTETNSIKNDGGGIYLFEAAYTSTGGIKIYDNIVVNTQASHIGTNGTNKLSHGIYLDGRTQSIEMYGNTSANNEGAGLLIGAWTRNIDMSLGNTLYNNEYQLRILRWTPETAYPNIDISNTLMFSRTTAQYTYLFECTSAFPGDPAGVKDFITNLGTVNNNYMGKVTGDSNIAIIAELPAYLYKTLPTWRTYCGLDASSTLWIGVAGDILFDYNETLTNKVITGLVGYENLNNVPVTSYTLLPYESIILVHT